MLVIYYSVAFFINAVCAFVFRQNINITIAAVCPLFLMILSLFQGFYFNNNRSKGDFNTSSSADLTEDEWSILSVYMSYSYFIAVPVLIPFALFFGTPIKVLSIFVYLLAFSAGHICYRIKHSKEYTSRMKLESDELKEQLKKEELGKIK